MAAWKRPRGRSAGTCICVLLCESRLVMVQSLALVRRVAENVFLAAIHIL